MSICIRETSEKCSASIYPASYLCSGDGVLEGGELGNELGWLVLFTDGSVLGAGGIGGQQVRKEGDQEER